MTPQQAATAPLDELRDWCAGDDGWTLEAYGIGHLWYPRGWPDCNEPVRSKENHPYPPTLDGADSAVPEGWWWMRDGAATSHRPDGLLLKWTACERGADNWGVAETPDTGDKIRDLFCLAVLCRIAGKGQSGG